MKHGFLVIDNDPNVPYSEKFYYGLAEELPFDLDHIIGCEESWKDNRKQLWEIGDGSMASKIERIALISKPEGIPIPKPNGGSELGDVGDRKRPVWDARAFAPQLQRSQGSRVAPII